MPDDDENTGKAELWKWLNQLREDAGISINGLASILEVDRKSVKRWLGLDVKPTEIGGVNLLRLLRALGVQVEPRAPGALAAPVSVLLDEINKQLDQITEILQLTIRRSEQVEGVVGEVAESQGRVLKAVDGLRERLELLEKERPDAPRNRDAR